LITAKFDEESWKRKVRGVGGSGGGIEKLVRLYANRVLLMAKERIQPIYADHAEGEKTGKYPWVVTGQLKARMGIDPKINYGGGKYIGIVYADVPYARLRHYVNKAHPSTIGYFSKPLFKIRGPLRRSLKSLYKG